jgi:NAD(P) transhydrogenase subunit alpha
MIVGVPRETAKGETRVAITPAAAAQLIKSKVAVVVEQGAGVAAGFDDAAYVAKGAVVKPRAETLASADVLLQVRTLAAADTDFAPVKRGALLIGFCDPLGSPGEAVAVADAGLSLIAMELIPRISRAQAMDALSSQANIAGYKAVVMAAERSPKIFPMLMTAAGTLQAARVFVIGAGVAGLQAIATARRLGAVVSAFDVRAAVKEQVMSVGAKFVELPLGEGTGGQDSNGYAKALTEEQQRKQSELMEKVIAESDVVITTASIPGRPAPRLISAAAVARMQPGSVIVDLAAERGGNCELTQPGQTVVRNGVTIIGHANIPATVPFHASTMYANNLVKLLGLMISKEGVLTIDAADEVIAGCLVAHGGAVVHPRVKELLPAENKPGNGNNQPLGRGTLVGA